MSKLQSPPNSNEPLQPSEFELPPGNHPLEIAARKGIGPLSPSGTEVWHGFGEPCVSCGQLVKRGSNECDQCGQDLSPAMLQRMRAHAGPWYVLEHVRPFPGVSLERIIRQVRRGLITETSIVRGPASDNQWRFATEIPGLCRYFGRCWQCHREVSPSDAFCQHCLSHLAFEKPQATPTDPHSASVASGEADPNREAVPAVKPTVAARRQGPTRAVPESAGRVSHPGLPSASTSADSVSASVAPKTPTDEIRRLSAAVGQIELPSHEPIWDEPPRLAGIRATWLAAALLIVVIIVLLLVTQTRLPSPTPTPAPAPGIVQPNTPSPLPGGTAGG